MRRCFLAAVWILAISTAVSCSRSELSPGDRILARWDDGFYEATVVRVDGKLVELAWDKPPPERGWQPSDYVVKVGTAPEKGAAWALCREGVRYSLCSGGEQAVPSGLKAWAEEVGQRLRLAQPLESATLVPQALGRTTEPGQRVAALWSDGRYYAAQVVRAVGDRIEVDWADGSGAQEVAKEQVAPLRGDDLRPEEFVLCEEAGARMAPAVVLAISPPGTGGGTSSSWLRAVGPGGAERVIRGYEDRCVRARLSAER